LATVVSRDAPPPRAGPVGELFSVNVRTRLGDGWQDGAYLARQPFFRTYPRLFCYETGVHFLDTFRYLGGEISPVYARLQQRNAASAGEDAAQIICGFASGATAIPDASRYNESDAADARYTCGTVRLDGRNGHLELALDGTLTLKLLGPPTRVLDYPHTPRRLRRRLCLRPSTPLHSLPDERHALRIHRRRLPQDHRADGSLLRIADHRPRRRAASPE